MVVSSTVMLALIGLAVDVGYLELLQTRMQTAADAAAMGGVQEFRMNGSNGVTAAAKRDAAANGFTDGVNSVTVTVNRPPATGYSTSDPTAVEVIVTQHAGTLFLNALGLRSATVKARAVAKQPSASTCMYALDPAASGALSVSGGVGITSACGIVVDSSSATAFSASGGATLTAPSISVTGNYSISGGASVSPTPAAHAAAQSDPLAYISAPAVGACNFTGFSVSGGATKTISPGVYCGGISISGGSTVTFNSGTYVMLGGGLSFSGGATITGDGVTVYNTYDGTHPYGSIQMSGGATVTLSAPTTGSLAGMLFFQDRSVAGGAASSFSGGASLNLTGALYFPTTAVSYSGGTKAPYTILVAKSISFSGGVKINNDYSSLANGSPVKGSAAISE